MSHSPVSVVSTPKSLHSNLSANGSSLKQSQSSSHKRSTSISINKDGSNKRVEIDSLVIDFQKKLGDKWDKYQVAVSLFLVGKLSRHELMSELRTILDKSTIRLHNQLLLSNLANSLRDEPQDGGVSSAGFGSQLSQQAKKRKQSNKSSQYELLKKDILSLSIRERKRLKSISRDSGKKGMLNSTISITRQSMVPRVPIVTNVENHPGLVPPNTNPAALTAQWGQDVLSGITAPLASETYELPDKANLKTRILGIAREHGLVGSVSDNVPSILSLGLEYHLKSIIENAMGIVRVKEKEDATLGSTSANGNAGAGKIVPSAQSASSLHSSPKKGDPNANGSLLNLTITGGTMRCIIKIIQQPIEK
ncbi:unnamed protein product [Ambrosiozyma monospora]|uniref:Unnamed protein product n=1 Tax=Ambrosiozyma monospora TaxID=43982 RepID=A0A9W6YZV9_AMBMO|nr:unnamed protein product [Ambrosiozyma monospora]